MNHQTTPETISPPQRLANMIDTVTLDLLASWRAQDATDDPDERQAAEQDIADFKKAINEARSGADSTRIYP